MACDKAKELTFRLFEYDLPPTVGKGGKIHDSNENAAYHDTGKEFTITEDEAKEAYRVVFGHMPNDPFTTRSIPCAMLSKLFGFNNRFVAGWELYWTKQGDEGYIGSPTYKCWHIKRVV